jgi:hypothetical protein
MISGVPLFRGRDNQDQLLHIMRIIGTPDDRTLRKIAQDSVSIVCLPALVVQSNMPTARNHVEAIPAVCEDTIPASDS